MVRYLHLEHGHRSAASARMLCADSTTTLQSDGEVILLSPTGDKNYPWKTRTKSTYDMSLEDGTKDEAYLYLLHDWLPRLFESHKPQLLFFQAGVDAMVDDSFGRC